MSKNNHWLRSISVVLIVALILTVTSIYIPLEQDISPFIKNFVSATPDNHLIKSMEADNGSEYIYPSQYMKFESEYEDGKVSVIIGFTGEPARGIQHQAKFAQQKTLINSFGGEVKKGFTIINAVSARLPLQAIEALSRRPEISFIEPDHEVTVVSQKTPWGISRIFGSEEYYFPTWDHSTGQGIAIAVLDTGIDKNHVDLPNLLGGVNTIDDTHWGLDSHGHGTHVAGTIAALDNNTGVVGVAPGAGLYAVKVMNDEGKGTYSSVISGIEWAFDKSIPVLNMSLGGGSHSKALKDAVDAAYDGGALLVAAAGNDGDSTDNVLYPARYSSVIAVSASDSQDKLAKFSSRGPSVELIAPGENILSLWPGNYMVHSSGTSMASPHVAGSAALLWAADNSLSNTEVRQYLQQTTEDLGLPSNHQGYGLIRADLAMTEVLISGDGGLEADTNLSSLIISNGILTPEFDAKDYEYIANVDYNIDEIGISAYLSDTNQNMTINGDLAISGVPKTVTLNPAGTLTEVKITVFVDGSTTQQTYTIVVKRAPGPPVLTSPAHGEIVPGSSVVLEWAPSTGATHYGVFVYNLTKDEQVLFEVAGEGTSYKLEGLPDNGDIYAWSVIANNFENGLWSDFAIPIVFINGSDKDLLPPTLISPENNASIPGSSVVLEWAPSTGATHYAVWIYNLSTDEQILFEVVGDVTSYTLEGLTDTGDTYAWSVVANNYFEGIWSDFAFPRLFNNK